MSKKNEERAELLAGAYQRQYHHNDYPELSNNSEFVTSKEEIKEACMVMAIWKDSQCLGTLLRVFDLIANKRDAGEALKYIKETLEFIIKDHYGDFDKNKINKTIMKSYCNLMCIGNSENCIMLAPCKEYNNINNIISEIDSKEE